MVKTFILTMSLLGVTLMSLNANAQTPQWDPTAARVLSR